MIALTLAVIAHLAVNPSCAVPDMVPEFWPAVIGGESHGDPLTLHDDTTDRAYYPPAQGDRGLATRRRTGRAGSMRVELVKRRRSANVVDEVRLAAVVDPSQNAVRVHAPQWAGINAARVAASRQGTQHSSSQPWAAVELGVRLLAVQVPQEGPSGA